MTREEYINFANCLKNNYTIDFDVLPEFCDMAISALKEEPAPFDFELFQAGLMDMPDGMTNGEVIQALFPNISVYEHGSTYSVNNEYNFNSTWWNAPYQKGGEA